jgi:hypothetical protein
MVNRIGYTDYVNVEHLSDVDNPHDTTYDQVGGASNDHLHEGVYINRELLSTFDYIDTLASNNLTNYTTTGTWEYFMHDDSYLGYGTSTEISITYTPPSYNDFGIIYQKFVFDPQGAPFTWCYEYAKDRRIVVYNNNQTNQAYLQKYTTTWETIPDTTQSYTYTFGNDITLVCEWIGNVGIITVNNTPLCDGILDLPDTTGSPLKFGYTPSGQDVVHVHRWEFSYTPSVDIINTFSFIPTDNSDVPFLIRESHNSMVTYLNADMLDDYHATDFATSTHDHDELYSGATHDHDSDYSSIDHDHDSSYPAISSGTDVPSSTPSKVGDIYVDTSNKKLYFATGNGTSSDWTVAN